MKKNRLLEIIREEIDNTLSKNKYINEGLLTEGPFIEGPLDFAYIDGKVEKGILGKAIADATKEIQKSFPEADADATTKIITSKKSRTAEKTPEPVKAALKKVDDAIYAQLDTFDDEKLLKDLLNKKEIGKSPEEIKRISSYITPDKYGNVQRYVEKLGFPQTERAVQKVLSGESPSETSTSSEPEQEPSSEPTSAATLTPGDDGFDDVTYNKPKKSEPKKSEPKKETEKGPKTSSSKLDKISDDRDQLLKVQKQAEGKMKELAQKMKGAEGKERDKIMDELKKVNKVKAEVDKKLDNLGF